MTKKKMGKLGGPAARLSPPSHASARVSLPSAPAGGRREDGTRASAWPLHSPFLQKRKKKKKKMGKLYMTKIKISVL